MKDPDLQRAILEALEADERLSSQPITVEVANGTVTLSGEVQSFRRKLVAQEVAMAVSEEATVDNHLGVSAPENPVDEDIGEDVRALIEEHAKLVKEAVAVEVRAGRVTLSGSVATEAERTLVGDVALQAPGAVHVSNQLTIEAGTRAESFVVGTELQRVLASAQSLRGSEFRVAITGNVAVLSGTAASREHIDIALGIVRKAWVGGLKSEVILED